MQKYETMEDYYNSISDIYKNELYNQAGFQVMIEWNTKQWN